MNRVSLEKILYTSILFIPITPYITGIMFIYLFFKTWKIQGVSIIPNSIRILIYTFFLYSFIQSFFLDNKLNHYIGLIIHYLFIILFFKILSKIIDGDKKFDLLIASIINSGFILSILSINIYILSKLNLNFIEYINTNFFTIQFYDRASGISMNPNVLAIYLIMSLFLLLGYKENNSFNFQIKVLTNIISLFFTYSRGAITSLLFTLPFLLKKEIFRVLYIIPIFIFIDNKWIDRIINSFDFKSRLISTRLFIWGKSLEIISNNPLGIGILNFEEYYKKYNHENFILVPHAHNWYLQTVIESGIIGTILIFSIFFYIVYFFIKNLNKNHFYIVLSLIAFSIFNLTDYIFWDIRIKIILTTIIFAGFYKIYFKKLVI